MRFRTPLFFVCLIFISCALPAMADTNVSGTISTNTTWSLANSPYVVTGGTTVNPGVTLIIQAGVTVKFNGGQYLDIGGTLTANGTSASPITFTSSSATPSAGAWNCIHFKPGSSASSQLSYATVTYSGGWNGGVVVEGCSPSIDHVTVSSSSSDGIKLMGTAPAPTITNCTLSSNSGYGVNLTSGSTATISGCTFTTNGNYAIGAEPNTNLQDLSNLTATGNGGGSKNAIGYRGGSITTAEHWINGSLWREITGGTTVNAGVTLTIDPGTTIKFTGGQWLDVGGTLVANGTNASPITFTSSSATPSAGAWNCLHFKPGSSAGSQLSYASVSYSGGFYAGVLIEGCSPSLDHVTVSNSSGEGIRVTGTSPGPTITNCTLSSNSSNGVGLTAGSTTISGCTFASNSGYGINQTSASTATITGCTFTSNGNYAIGAEPNTNLQGLSNLTATGNGGGSKNAIGYRGGSITTAEHWINGSLPREITAATSVNAGFTLTIDPGATIKFASGQWLSISGTLLANGTAALPILFTSNAASPAPGAWNEIHFYQGSTASQMSYATISYAGGFQAALIFDGSSPTIDHVTVTNCTTAVKVNTGAPTLHHCAFVNNSNGITNAGTGQVNATLCYWGAADGPSTVGHGSGESVSWYVTFDPWLTANPSTPEYVSALTVQNRAFNPSLSAYPTITPTFALSANWTVTILNSTQAVLRSYTGSGQTATVTWDGNDGNGVELSPNFGPVIMSVAPGYSHC